MTEQDLYYLALKELTKEHKIPFRVYLDDEGELAHELFDHEPEGGSPLPDGVVTPSVLNAKIAEVRVSEAWRELREERDRLIAETDWVVTRAVDASNDGLGIQLPQVWVDYRQALRDLPANTVDPANPVWPVKPQ